MTYFKPLRRKIGILTLVMACVAAAFWIATLNVGFKRQIPFSLRLGEGPVLSSFHVVYSANGSIRLTKRTQLFIDRSIHFGETEKANLPYSMIVIPLTLLSAWLLFSKTRAKGKPHVSN